MKTQLLYIAIAFLTLAQNLTAQGDLLVSPVRVIFEGNKQKEDISLVNIGNDTAIYSVSFVQYDMAENGDFVIVDQPKEGQKYADPYLRVFPRRVILAPHASQVVRLQLRRAPGMEDGEYRSHLYFRAEKGNKVTSAGFSDKQKLLSVEITPVFGISIPVIIRIGNVRGIAVYTCSTRRLFTVRLTNLAGLNLKSGKVRVLFTSPKDTRHEVYAQKELDL